MVPAGLDKGCTRLETLDDSADNIIVLVRLRDRLIDREG
jgi:hypothetical protein